VFKYLHLAFFFLIYAFVYFILLMHVCWVWLNALLRNAHTWKLHVRYGSSDLPYDYQSGFKFIKPFDSLLSVWTGSG